MKTDKFGLSVCEDDEHEWHEMHHFGESEGPTKQLLHYCPTGFMSCSKCTATRKASEEEQTCFKWGKP